MTLIDKINQFESLDEQTVFQFNKIFTGCEILSGNLEDTVSIGEIHGPENVRVLLINGREVFHTFTIASVQPFLGLESFSTNVAATKFDRSIFVNANAENLVLETREMEMDALEYKLLQYFRGATSSYHTQAELAVKLNKSVKSVRGALRRMEEGEIIKMKVFTNLHKMVVSINESWL